MFLSTNGAHTSAVKGLITAQSFEIQLDDFNTHPEPHLTGCCNIPRLAERESKMLMLVFVILAEHVFIRVHSGQGKLEKSRKIRKRFPVLESQGI